MDETVESQQESEYTQKSEIKFKPSQPGLVKCKARNKIGHDNKIGHVQIGDLTRPFMVSGIEEDQKIAEGDYVRLECAAIIYNYKNESVWRKDGVEIEAEENNTKFSWRKSITWKSISKEDSGVYECEGVPVDPTKKQEPITISINVLDPEAPHIIPNFNSSLITHSVGDSFTLDCYVTGLPVPSLLWYKDDQIFIIDESNEERVSFVNGNSSIYFKVLIPDDAGTYKCVAYSRVGEDVKSVQLEIPSESLIA